MTTPSAYVLVIGNYTVDLSFMVPRFTAPGETLLATEKLTDLGGKGANQAVAALRFGARTTLAAPIGNDEDGDWSRRRLNEAGLALDHLLLTETATDQSLIFIIPSGENSIVSTQAAAAQASPSWATGIVASAPAGSAVLMQGNLSLATTRAALAAARDRGLVTVLNPAPIHYDFDSIYTFVDVLVVNETEARHLGRMDDAIAAGRALHDKHAVGTVIVTLGARGAVAFCDGGPIELAAPAVKAIDSVGAGDVFCGALTACLARGAGLDQAMQVAVAAASLAVTRRGTQSAFPTYDEANDLMIRHGVPR